MFKIPEWGDDVPKSNINYVKNEHTKKSKQKTKSNQNAVKTVKSPRNIGTTIQQVLAPASTKKKKKHKNLRNSNKESDSHTSPRELQKTVGRFVSNPAVSTNGTGIPLKLKKEKHKPKNKSQKSRHGVNTKMNDKETSIINNRNKIEQYTKETVERNVKVNNEESSTDQIKSDTKIKSRKRKHSETKTSNDSNDNLSDLDMETLDEAIIDAKKKKLNDTFKREVSEETLFYEDTRPNVVQENGVMSSQVHNVGKHDKVNTKKEKLKKILSIVSNSAPIDIGSNKLRERMLERLKAAQFRYLNEKLYTSSGTEAKNLFQSDPEAFHLYHQGYQQQLKKWPVNPLDVIVKKILKMPKSHLIADMGCGEAALAKRVPQTVRSFDLVSTAPGVECCDMAHTPLPTLTVDVAVYCLALMGTDLTQYLLEANRVLKMGGQLLIAEVESRFDNVNTFTNDVQSLGFKLKTIDNMNQVFFFMEFVKVRDPPKKKSKLPALTLKPCLYKKR